MRTTVITVAVVAAVFLLWGWRAGKAAEQSDFSFVIPSLIGAVLCVGDVLFVLGVALYGWLMQGGLK